MKTSVPIVYFHAGNPHYLKLSLEQTRRTNPHSQIILFGDKSNDVFDFVTHVDMEDYNQIIDKVAQSYKHLSTNDANYEFLCFVRWFIINEYVKENNIEKFFVTDSDVFLYCDISEEQKKFEKYRYTLCAYISAGISFINDINVLEEYCQLYMNVFSQKDAYNFGKCFYHFQNLQQNQRLGGVCDMTLWEIHKKSGPVGSVGETSTILDGTTFDHNINESAEYKMENGVKKVYWKNGLPYCRHERLNEMIKFNCLHFQGVSGKVTFLKETRKGYVELGKMDFDGVWPIKDNEE